MMSVLACDFQISEEVETLSWTEIGSELWILSDAGVATTLTSIWIADANSNASATLNGAGDALLWIVSASDSCAWICGQPCVGAACPAWRCFSMSPWLSTATDRESGCRRSGQLAAEAL